MNIISSIINKIFHPHASHATPTEGVPSSLAAPTTSTTVDVEQLLTAMAADRKEHLDWRHSIVDLMKMLNLDSGISARKQLATELGYNGNMSDSASMNVWLHEAVMKKLAENGGKVPDDIKH